MTIFLTVVLEALTKFVERYPDTNIIFVGFGKDATITQHVARRRSNVLIRTARMLKERRLKNFKIIGDALILLQVASRDLLVIWKLTMW